MTDTTTNGASCCTPTATAEQPQAIKTFSPRVDIAETDAALFLYADLPGASPHDIELRYEQGELTLHAKVPPRPAQGRTIFNEYDVGDFHRVFQVHDSIDAEKIEAEYKNGVLIVRLPKQEAVKPKQVPIRVTA